MRTQKKTFFRTVGGSREKFFCLAVPLSRLPVSRISCGKRIGIVLFVALICAGCRLDLGVGLKVRPDGTGIVLFSIVPDRTFLEVLGNKGFSEVGDVFESPGAAVNIFQDLLDEGWRLREREKDVLVFSHAFREADEVLTLARQFGGPQGAPITRFVVTTKSGFWKDTVAIELDVVYRADLLLNALLRGVSNEPTSTELYETLGVDFSRSTLDVFVSLEGELLSVDPPVSSQETFRNRQRPESLAWSLSPGEEFTISAAAESWSLRAKILGVLFFCWGMGGLFLFVRARRDRSHQKKTDVGSAFSPALPFWRR